MPLSAKQLRAIDVLLTARSQGAAARRLKMDPKTLRRWLKEPEFSRELASAQRLAIAQNLRGIVGMAATAMRTLCDLMKNGKDAKFRFEAANAALERLFDADLVMRTDEGSQPQAIPGDAGK